MEKVLLRKCHIFLPSAYLTYQFRMKQEAFSTSTKQLVDLERSHREPGREGLPTPEDRLFPEEDLLRRVSPTRWVWRVRGLLLCGLFVGSEDEEEGESILRKLLAGEGDLLLLALRFLTIRESGQALLCEEREVGL